MKKRINVVFVLVILSCFAAKAQDIVYKPGFLELSGGVKKEGYVGLPSDTFKIPKMILFKEKKRGEFLEFSFSNIVRFGWNHGPWYQCCEVDGEKIVLKSLVHGKASLLQDEEENFYVKKGEDSPVKLKEPGNMYSAESREVGNDQNYISQLKRLMGDEAGLRYRIQNHVKYNEGDLRKLVRSYNSLKQVYEEAVQKSFVKPFAFVFFLEGGMKQGSGSFTESRNLAGHFETAEIEPVLSGRVGGGVTMKLNHIVKGNIALQGALFFEEMALKGFGSETISYESKIIQGDYFYSMKVLRPEIGLMGSWPLGKLSPFALVRYCLAMSLSSSMSAKSEVYKISDPVVESEEYEVRADDSMKTGYRVGVGLSYNLEDDHQVYLLGSYDLLLGTLGKEERNNRSFSINGEFQTVSVSVGFVF